MCNTNFFFNPFVLFGWISNQDIFSGIVLIFQKGVFVLFSDRNLQLHKENIAILK